MDVDEILKRISSKGDVAAAALGFVAGYGIDLVLAPHGLVPGTAAGLGATGLIGFKNGIQALWDEHKSNSKEKKAAKGLRADLESSVVEMEKLFADNTELTNTKTQLRADCELWKRKLLSDDELRKTIERCVMKYRNAISPPPRPSRSERLEIREV